MTPTEANEAWIVQTSRYGEQGRLLGKAWVRRGESLIVHCMPAFVDPASRQELWPDETHRGLPVLLPGAEEGRLLRFVHNADRSDWKWALEFRGRQRDSVRLPNQGGDAA